MITTTLLKTGTRGTIANIDGKWGIVPSLANPYEVLFCEDGKELVGELVKLGVQANGEGKDWLDFLKYVHADSLCGQLGEPIEKASGMTFKQKVNRERIVMREYEVKSVKE